MPTCTTFLGDRLLSHRCLSIRLSCLSVCHVGVLWPKGWMDQNETWHAGRPRPDHIVLDGDPAPLPHRGTVPNFSAHIYCGHSHPIFGPCLLWPNGCMYQDATWYGGRPQPRRHCVRWAPAPPPLKGYSTQFSANVRCG